MTVIIWKGKGWMVLVITFVISLIAQLITIQITGDENSYQAIPYPLSIALLISAVCMYFIIRYYTSKLNDVLIDKVSIYNSYHHLFFIPMGVWVWILCGLSMINILRGILY
ncbi:MAG: hypothetical protein KDC11_05440 [Chitinophagaceae bacterium]|nr:hypothetical protein [Chitinophagaceae bacterium]